MAKILSYIYKKLISIINSIIGNSSFYSYLGLVLTLFVSIRILDSAYMLNSIDSEILAIHYIRSLVDAMLLAIPISFLKKKWILALYLSIINIYFLSIVWYFRNYGTIMPLESYTMIQNLHGIEGSIIQSIKLRDFILILPSIVYCFFLFYCKKIKLFSISDNWKYILLSLFIIIGFTSPYILFQKNNYRFPYYAFRTEIVRGFKQFGITHFWIYQIHTMKGCSKEEKQIAILYMNKNQHKRLNIINTNNKKNLILIIVESLCSWPLNINVVGQEITPNINKLIKQKGVLYFPYVLPQVKDGRSSDAQLMINTGLLPINTGAVSSLYAQNKYPALAKELKKIHYTTASLVCDDKTYWNQSATSKAYGFDYLYDNLSDHQSHTNMDEHLFSHVIKILEKTKQPYYTQIVTLSSHSPYIKGTFTNPFFEKASFKTSTSKYYSMAIHYVDKCIGTFINALKDKGIYNNSIIIITGDHDDEAYNHFVGRERCFLSDRYIPLIILNSPLKTSTKNIIGQIDIYPSILDIMGIYNNEFDGLGESVFRRQLNNAVYHTNEYIGSNKDIKRKQELWNISDILIRMDFFKRNK